MRRVLVIGSGGSGKSTLAREIGARTGLPVVHLDQHYWRPGWTEPSTAEWEATVRALVAEDAWVMDGNYGGTFHLRFPEADTLVFLDRSRWLCLWRVVRRWILYRGRTRPDVAPRCPERLTLGFVRWILGYPRTRRPGVLARLEAARDEARVVVLRSEEHVRRFLAEIAGPARRPPR